MLLSARYHEVTLDYLSFFPLKHHRANHNNILLRFSRLLQVTCCCVAAQRWGEAVWSEAEGAAERMPVAAGAVCPQQWAGWCWAALWSGSARLCCCSASCTSSSWWSCTLTSTASALTSSVVSTTVVAPMHHAGLTIPTTTTPAPGPMPPSPALYPPQNCCHPAPSLSSTAHTQPPSLFLPAQSHHLDWVGALTLYFCLLLHFMCFVFQLKQLNAYSTL